MDLHELSAIDLALVVRRREVSVREVTEHTLARAEARSDTVGAFVHLTPDYALAQADALDARISRGESLDLPLLGVPCPIKDLNQVAGLPWECGSTSMRGNVASDTDGVVSWLTDAGAVMPGKTSTPEFGLPCYTEPDNAPASRTPWDLTRSAGGSSGGAAAAVASGIVPIAQGSDGGGSIRIPASSCGLVGLKASRGVVSWGPLGVDGPGLATNGVLARTVRDAALGLDVISRWHDGDTFFAPSWGAGVSSAGIVFEKGVRGGGACGTLPPPLSLGLPQIAERFAPKPSRTQSLPNSLALTRDGNLGRLEAGDIRFSTFLDACDWALPRLRVGVLTTPVIASTTVHLACLEAVARTSGVLADLGHRVDSAPVPMAVEQWEAFAAIWAVGAASIPVPPESERLLRPLTQWLREQGLQVTGLGLSAALDAVQRLTRQVAAAWEAFDVILTPTLARPPALVGELRDDADPAGDFAAQTRFTPWTSLYNLTGRPAISLPLHTAQVDGRTLPIGVMIGGRLGADATLLALAAQLEEASPWRHPYVGGDLLS